MFFPTPPHLPPAQLGQPVPPRRRLQLLLQRRPLLLHLTQLSLGLSQLALVLAAQRGGGLVPELSRRACRAIMNWRAALEDTASREGGRRSC